MYGVHGNTPAQKKKGKKGFSTDKKAFSKKSIVLGLGSGVPLIKGTYDILIMNSLLMPQYLSPNKKRFYTMQRNS